MARIYTHDKASFKIDQSFFKKHKKTEEGEGDVGVGVQGKCDVFISGHHFVFWGGHSKKKDRK